MNTQRIGKLVATLTGAGGAIVSGHVAGALAASIAVLLIFRVIDLLTVLLLQRVGFTPNEINDFVWRQGKDRGS